MSIYYIENEQIKIGVRDRGAELVSLVKKATGQEYMWCGDDKYWGRVSPVLFPFVGKLVNQSYRHNGIEYTNIPQHGFARDSQFRLAEQGDDRIWFELTPDEEWKSHYPFQFLLRIGYRIEGDNLHVMWCVRNDSPERMYFSIGAHPAFNCQGGLKGYALDFNVPRNQITAGELSDKGVLKDDNRSFDLENGKLKLNDEIFEKDALIIDGKGINKVDLLNPAGETLITVKFDTPQLGIWSPAGKRAPFVCIEPWFGRSDREDFTGTLSEREYGNALDPGHSFNKEYVIIPE